MNPTSRRRMLAATAAGGLGLTRPQAMDEAHMSIDLDRELDGMHLRFTRAWQALWRFQAGAWTVK